MDRRRYSRSVHLDAHGNMGSGAIFPTTLAKNCLLIFSQNPVPELKLREAEVAPRLRDYASKLPGREQLAVLKCADSLESIPLTLAENAGMDPIDVQVEFRA